MKMEEELLEEINGVTLCDMTCYTYFLKQQLMDTMTDSEEEEKNVQDTKIIHNLSNERIFFFIYICYTRQ
jgi:hypothetical protein